MVSFDVENLFPSIPPKECIQLVANHLTHSDLSDPQVSCILSLLNITIQQNFFKFQGDHYSQDIGLAMGSNLSPLLAEIFMNNLEMEFISKHQFYKDHVIFWARYVDDIICLHSALDSDIHNFLNHLNKIHPNIKFTIEKESNHQIPFLDLLLHRSQSTIDYSIYRKPTTTDNVIPNDSEHPVSHKVAGFYSLLHRLHKIPMSLHHFNKEFNTIKQIAINNGFPVRLVDKLSQKNKNSLNPTLLIPIKPVETIKIYKSLPFYPKISYSIQHIFKTHNIHISFSSEHSLHSSIVRNKDKLDRLEYSGVYQLNCHTCPSFYIGQTGRPFSTRFLEHHKYIKCNNLDRKSAMAEHILTSGHDFDHKRDFNILHKCNKGPLLNTLEILEINRHKNNPALLNEIVDFQPYSISLHCI
ncbi:hypothetical protein RI129_004201 [Pyrocoelia pectoralis]|uniref:Reverse transcriptase domain-containing protein n=1 Tax=Pyrocoelia pectoralis TaxID=417401 RepID=A0AAN7ZJ29_9COLE